MKITYILASIATAALASAALADVTVTFPGPQNLTGSTGFTMTSPAVSGTLTGIIFQFDYSNSGGGSWAADMEATVDTYYWGGFNVTNLNGATISAGPSGALQNGTAVSFTSATLAHPAPPTLTNQTVTVGYGNGYTAGSCTMTNVSITLVGVNPGSGPYPPSLSGSAGSPSPAGSGAPLLITTHLSPGGNPASTGLVVTADLSALGGSASAAMNDSGTGGDAVAGDGIYSVTTTAPTGYSDSAPGGPFAVTINAHDAQARNAAPATVNINVRSQAWDETLNGGGDAGQDLTTAQVPVNMTVLGAITGTFGANDVDIYKIKVCDAASFGATTANSTVLSDTQLFLFNPDGTGVSHNDDSAAGTYSTMDNTGVVTGNNYFLAISQYNIDPVDASGALLWNNTNSGGTFTGTRAPDGPAAANPFASWTGTTAGGVAYRITLTGACIPGPNSCSAADIGIQGGTPGQDNHLDNNDFVVFINNFFNNAASADIGIQGGTPGHDGVWDNNDFIVFINIFFNDQANCTG